MKRKCAAILIILIVQAIFRALHIFALESNSKSGIALCTVILSIFLPIIYSFLSFFLLKKSAGILLNYISMLLAGFAVTLFLKTAFIKEVIWIAIQTPALIVSYFMAHLAFSLDTRTKKLMCAISYAIIGIIAALFVYYFIFIMISQGGSRQYD